MLFPLSVFLYLKQLLAQLVCKGFKGQSMCPDQQPHQIWDLSE